jgi:hypothetical protein
MLYGYHAAGPGRKRPDRRADARPVPRWKRRVVRVSIRAGEPG